MPEEFYNFRPTPEVRSFGELMAHIAESNYEMGAIAKGEDSPVLTVAPTKREVVEALKDSFDYCAAARKNMTKKQKSWGIAPIDEASENTQSLNLDKRTLRKTGRVHLFATRVKKEWIEQLKSIAYEERKHYNEVLEKALECYSKHRK